MDWLLLGVILLGLLLAGWYFWQHRKSAQEEVALLVVMRIPAVERDLAEQASPGLIPAGSVLRTENGTFALGVVQSVSLRERLSPYVQEKALAWEPDPYLCDMEVTVRMNAVQQGNEGLRVHDLRVAAGGLGNFRFGSYFAAGTEIVSVEVISNEGTE